MNDVEGAVTWQSLIKGFLAEKFEADFVKYLKEVFKAVGQIYASEGLTENEEIEFLFDTRKNRREAEQLESEFILEQLKKLENFDKKPTSFCFETQSIDINTKRQELNEKYLPKTWLSWAADNAKNVTFATHVAKLTHSAIDSTSFFDSSNDKKDDYLTTSSLSKLAIDGAVRGNQYAPIYQFLELELNHKKLAGEFNNIDTNLLDEFASNHEQKQTWNHGFSQALSEGKPSAHFLLKQVYFPIDKENYNLLCNLVSSSKAQALFEFARRNSDTNFKLRNNKKYSPEIYFNFPNRASISITASNHGNASQLNGKRGGRLGLFSCQPPVWQTQLKPPIYTKIFFYELSKNYEVKETIQYLADFLARFESLDLSIKDPKRMRWVEQWLENLSDEVLVYVKTIQNLPSGWSDNKDIKLKQAHQFLLDCHRQDEAFINAQESMNWQQVVLQDFAIWLNRQLTWANDKLTPQDSHTKLWIKLFEANFREVLELKHNSQQEA